MSRQSPTVLVLDGEQRAALAVIRSLGRRGCRVYVGARSDRSIGGGSRFAASEIVLPSPVDRPDDYITEILRAVERYRPDVVLPVTEESTLALLERVDRLGQMRVPGSDLGRFSRATDKATVLSIAEGLGIAVPKQLSLAGHPGDELQVPADQFPVVVKPFRSVVASKDRRKVGVRYAGSGSELRDRFDEIGTDAGPFLVQERIEGPGVGIFILRWQGQVVATFAHRRIREKPPSGGVSVCCESIAAPPALIAQSVSLLAALDWQGVAMVEFKEDQKSGRMVLMEVNPRFWGSLQLAIDAGVDFPWYLVQLAMGEPVTPVNDWKIGIRSKWLMGDVDHLLARLRRSAAELNLPPGAPSTLRTALEVLTPWRPRQRNDVLRASDPKPFARETVAWFRALFHR